LRPTNNLKQLSLALINYAAGKNGYLPPAIVTDTAGRPLYSWRVIILPYFEEDDLYNAFHLDEAWDSPHNIQMLERMPKAYARPNDPDAAKFQTCYRVFIGENATFPLPGPWPGDKPPSGRRIPQDFYPHETGRTFLVVEAAESVPWTKPDELVYDPDQPLPKLGRPSEDWLQASLMDLSVRSFRVRDNEKTLRSFIDRKHKEALEGSP
jgi:hypothetical protein